MQCHKLIHLDLGLLFPPQQGQFQSHEHPQLHNFFNNLYEIACFFINPPECSVPQSVYCLLPPDGSAHVFFPPKQLIIDCLSFKQIAADLAILPRKNLHFISVYTKLNYKICIL